MANYYLNDNGTTSIRNQGKGRRAHTQEAERRGPRGPARREG